MPSVATLYVIATTVIFGYTVSEHLSQEDTYFKAMMTYLADQSCVFVLYNMILSLAIMFYRLLSWVFFVNTMEGEVIKITDKLKNKIVDLIILAYIIDLKFNFQMYVLVVFVIFTFILHNHLIFRSEYLVHVYATSTSLNLHYRTVALYIILFFIDFQILKFIYRNMLSVAQPTEGLFVYYMVINSFCLLEPFMQFIIDFYEKYTFAHIKNSDQLIATASIFITIPRLLVQLIMIIWLSWQSRMVIFALIRGFDIVSNIKKTIDSYNRIKKLSETMTYLKKIKGEELSQFHDLTCTVCYQDMKESVLLPCKHIFHEQCIRQWIIKNLNHFCPKCKHQLNFDNIEALYEKKTQSPLDRMRAMIEKNNKNLGQNQPVTEEKKLREEGENLEREEKPRNEAYYPRKRGENVEKQREMEKQREQIEQDKQFSKFKGESRFFKDEKYRGRDQRIEVVDKEGRPIPVKQYVLDRPELSEYPLEVYESMRKKILPIGSLPFGMPSVAVSHRTAQHMSKRDEYVKDLLIITKLIEMDRNVQMMLL